MNIKFLSCSYKGPHEGELEVKTQSHKREAVCVVPLTCSGQLTGWPTSCLIRLCLREQPSQLALKLPHHKDFTLIRYKDDSLVLWPRALLAHQVSGLCLAYSSLSWGETKMKSCQLLGIEPRAFVLSRQCISTELQELDKYQPPWLIPGMLYGPIRLHPCKAHKGPAHYYLEIMNGQLKTMKQLWELIVKNKIRSHDHHCEVTWSPLQAHMITIVRSHDHCVFIWLLNHSLLTLSSRGLALRPGLNTI